MKNNYHIKTICFVALLVIINPFTNFKITAQIKFEQGNWSEIKAKAKKENKLIFVDAYTSWCGPCKWLAKNVFTNDTVAQYYNATFINASLDMEKGEGIDIAKQYNIRAYPSLLFIDANGEIVHRAIGSKKSSEFIQLGKNALIPEKQFATLEKKYKNGQHDAAFMLNYVGALGDLYLDTKEPLEIYFATQQETDLTNRQNWNIIYNYLNDCHSKTFDYFLKNSDVFAKKYTLDSVNKKIFNVYSSNCRKLSRSKDSAGYYQLKNEIQKANFSWAEELLLTTDLNYYLNKEDFDNYAQTAILFVNKYGKKDMNQVNSIAYEFYEKIKDKAMLAKAEQWAKEGYEIMPKNPPIIDTYACLLYVNGKKKEAIKLETEAIEITKSDPTTAESGYIKEFEKKVADWSK